MGFSKKIVLVCLFIALAFGGVVFAGAYKDNSASKVVTLNIMGYGDNSNSEGQTFKRICDEFMAANPGIKIDYELLYDEAYHQKVVARMAAKDYPDIAYMGADARGCAPWQEA